MQTRHTLTFIVFLCAAISANATTFQVQIKEYFFTPTNINISVGDTIQWTNAGAMVHDSTSTNAGNTWFSGNIARSNTFSLTFTNAGDFFYLCSTHFFAVNPHHEQTGHVIVASANLPPTVAITNPPNNFKLRAPAGFQLQASASDSGGSVTNVEFFSGAVPLGNDTSSPYGVPVNNLSAGNYAFTARATDNGGLITTSAVINVSVFTNASLSSPERLANGQFRFTLQGITGQSYAYEFSTNLTSWTAFATNVAPAGFFNVTDATSTNILRFYRARQDL
jgi:plastocyanin